MGTVRVTKFQWFWAWQDDKQEAWLEEMSREGLHLIDFKPFGRYVFEVGEPRGFTYRMDFDQSSGKDRDYYNLIEDAGWEHIIGIMGWQYWRKETVDGRTTELFTDADSKISKYKRFLASLFVPTPTFVVVLGMFKRFPGRHPQWVVITTISLYILYFIFLGINFLKVSQRIRELRQKRIF